MTNLGKYAGATLLSKRLDRLWTSIDRNLLMLYFFLDDSHIHTNVVTGLSIHTSVVRVVQTHGNLTTDAQIQTQF